MRLSSTVAPADQPLPSWLLYPLFFVGVYLSHITLLRLPYFWDEAGYYIPAAWDCFRTGTLIPQTTLTNAHPPLPSIVLAGWWHLAGFTVYSTRVLICLVSAAALLAVFRLVRDLAGPTIATAVTLLTALYPVWFAQSTLAHADIFAAAFTLWAFVFYLVPAHDGKAQPNRLAVAILFSLAALAKETAIVTPAALALWEAVLLATAPEPRAPRQSLLSLAALLAPALPLAAWYAYHWQVTGYAFGNPEFLRYNATANLGAERILLGLWHRVIHLTLHMNLYVPVGCTIAVLLMPNRREPDTPATSQPVLATLAVILLGNAVAFSVLGGALLTRYLLPMYPLVLLICVAQWKKRYRHWIWLAALSALAFVAGIFINPPYRFAPEDNLAYRDMVVLHQQAARIIEQQYPGSRVLTAWPATQELARPELGYSHAPIRVTPLEDFSAAQIAKAASEPEAFDTALVFSTKWSPAMGQLNLSAGHDELDTRLFDFHQDLSPQQTASALHGQVVWHGERNGEWAAVLRFQRPAKANPAPSQPPIIVR